MKRKIKIRIIYMIAITLVELNGRRFVAALSDDEELSKTMIRGGDEELSLNTISTSNQPPDDFIQQTTTNKNYSATLKEKTVSSNGVDQQSYISVLNNQSNIVLSDSGNYNPKEQSKSSFIISTSTPTSTKSLPVNETSSSKEKEPKNQSNVETHQRKLLMSSTSGGRLVVVELESAGKKRKRGGGGGGGGGKVLNGRKRLALLMGQVSGQSNSQPAEKMISYSAIKATQQTRPLEAASQLLLTQAPGTGQLKAIEIPPAKLPFVLEETGPEMEGELEGEQEAAEGELRQHAIYLNSKEPQFISKKDNSEYLIEALGSRNKEAEIVDMNSESIMFDGSLLPGFQQHSSSLTSSLRLPARAQLLQRRPYSGTFSSEPLGRDSEPEEASSSDKSKAKPAADHEKPKLSGAAPTSAHFFLDSLSSQGASEFETTLKQIPAPEQHQPPIELDANSEASSPESSSQAPTLKSASSTPRTSSEDNDADDDEEDSSTTAEHLEEKSAKIGKALSGGRQRTEEIGQRKPTRLDSSNSKPPKALASHELLVGPFKSELEAPATITLAGVTYQKSGVSSALVKASQVATIDDNLGAIGGSANPSLVVAPGAQAASSIYAPSQQAHQLDILLSSLKSANDLSALQVPYATRNINNSLLRLPEPYSGSAGGIRFNPLPFVGAALAANQQRQHQLNNDGLTFLGQSKQIQAKLNYLNSIRDMQKAAPPTTIKGNLESSQSLQAPASNDGLSSSASALSSVDVALNSIGNLSANDEPPIWTSAGSKKGEQYYLSSAASSDSAYHSKQPKEKSAPIVIVQKDVKPVKYHLLRAYLKLRRLLRPFEATYVFPNDSSSSFLKRRQQKMDPSVEH